MSGGFVVFAHSVEAVSSTTAKIVKDFLIIKILTSKCLRYLIKWG